MKSIPLKITKFTPMLLLLLFLAFLIFSPSLSRAKEITTGLPRTFRRAEDLTAGDTVFIEEDGQLKPDRIVEKVWVDEAVEVYNLTVDGDQTYFADDLAVHNKAEKLKAYFFWDIDGDGCHDDTTANIIYPRYRADCDNVDTRNPGAELIEPVVVHGAGSVPPQPNLPEMLEGDAYANWDSGYGPYRAFNDSIGDLNEMYTVHGKIALGAMIDGGNEGTWTFGQTNRGAEFRVGGWNFLDYYSGAGRRFHSYQRNDWVPGGDSWIIRDNDNFYMGYPVCVEAAAPGEIRWADFKAEKDYRGEQGGICEEFDPGPPWGDAFQIAEFTADYSGRYYMEHLHCSNDAFDHAGSLLFAKDNPADVVSLPRVIRETEDMCIAMGESHCAITDPQTYGFTGSLVGSFGCGSRRGWYWLAEGASYVLVTQVSDRGYHVSSGFPFWQYGKSRLLDIAPDRNVKQAVAAIPLIEALPPLGTIEGRVWEDDSLNCSHEPGENGIRTTITAGAYSDDSIGNGRYSIDVPPGDYTVSITIPDDYTVPDCQQTAACPGGAGTQCSIENVTVTSGGTTSNINFPIIGVSTITGHVWDNTANPSNCVQNPGEEDLPPGILVNASSSITGGDRSDRTGPPPAGDGPGDYTITSLINGDAYSVCVKELLINPGLGWSVGCVSRGTLAGDCATGINLTNDTTINFGLIYNADPWIQTAIGDVAAGTTIQSLIPDPARVKRYDSNPGEPNLSCDNSNCNPAPPDFYPGIVTAQNGGSIFINQVLGGQVSDKLWEVPGLGGGAGTYDISTSPGLADYRYSGLEEALKSRAEVINAGGGAAINDGKIHAGGAPTVIADERVYLIRGDADLNEPNADHPGFQNSATILIDGNLTVSQTFTPTDGFYAFIVSGNITIDPAVTDLKGIFLADGTIDTGLTTNQGLRAEGMFISWTAWTPSELQRDWFDKRRPTEYFVYDPQFLVELQESLGESRVSWREI